MITAASASSRVSIYAQQDSTSASDLVRPLSACITPLNAPAVNNIKWKNNCVANNRQIEANLARFASESPAAHKTVDALLATLNKLFILVEKDEIKVAVNMLRSYTSDVPNFSVVGQLGAGGFSRIMAAARHGVVHKGQEPLTLREKATAFYNLTNSIYFRETLEKIHGSLELQERAADIVNITYLRSKPFSPARGCTKERPLADQLAIYTFENENKRDASENVHLYEEIKEINGQKIRNNSARAGSSLTKSQNDFRDRNEHADMAWISAADLMADKRMTKRELAFARCNARNRMDRDVGQFGYQGPVKWLGALPMEQTVVARGNGFVIWKVKEGTGFFQDARLQHKPTVGGPSGTTDRFMTAARLLGNGLISELQLNQPKANETRAESDKRAEREMKELVRWMATGYLVDDNHHSMIEVNLGAANHGLGAQWGTSLYCEPFTAPIKIGGITISNEEIMRIVESQPAVKTRYENYRYDLQGGSGAKFWPDGRIT